MGRRKRRQRNLAILNFAIIAAAIAAIAFAVVYLQAPPFDEDTLCVTSDELPPHTAVVLDKTDEYSQIQSDLIASVIRRTKDRLDIGERFTIFELDAGGQFDPRGEFSLCNPGRGDQVNPLFRNPKLMEERFEEKFEAPLNAVLEDLVTPKEAPNSPILEALARLSQTEAFSDQVPERRVVLVSDMLQNSDIFTAYGAGGSMPARNPDALNVADQITERFGTVLRGVRLEIRLIPRERYADLQRGALREYWDEIFDDLGVRVTWRDL